MATIESNSDPRLRLLEAAGRVFAEKGFQEGTVREICQLAGANLAAVNYYFGDKLRLYIESVKQAHRTRIQQVPVPQWAEGTSPQEKLRSFIQAFVLRVTVESPDCWHFGLLVREFLHPTAACGEMVEDFIRPQFELLQQVLEEVVGHPIPEVRRHWLAFSVIGQCLHYRVTRAVIERLVSAKEFELYTPEQLTEHIAQFTLAALGVKPYPLSRPARVEAAV